MKKIASLLKKSKAKKPEAKLKNKKNDPKELKNKKSRVEQANSKPLDSALIGKALFVYLVKSKK